jgi:divalent metal cation (Fe/Co/Zn/Cd) transporter
VLVGRVRQLTYFTLVWLAVDGAIGMTAGIAANSVALIGWGLDCAIQAVAAIVILWRFSAGRRDSAQAERRAQQVVAVSYMLLVPYIIVVSVDQLLSSNAAAASSIGIALAATDAVVMPALGQWKARLGTKLGSCATRSAGKQNILCAYLSIGVLVGLGANALLGWWWADPTVALLVAGACAQAGLQAWRGEGCAVRLPDSGATSGGRQ